MKRLDYSTRLILCLLLIAYGQTASSAVRKTIPNIELLWRQYRDNDANKVPAVKYPYDHCFRAAARKYHLPLTLLLAVARGESNFNPRAKSDRNCHGLMQIQWPGTARHLEIYRLESLYEPCTNIRAGARYIRELLDRYDQNLHLALAAYNYGPSRIKNRAGADHIPRGAKWYSGYIYHHLKYILPKAAPGGTAGKNRPKNYERPGRLVLITFSQPYRADAYYRHLKKRTPSLDLSWYRIGLGRYQVVMLYSDANALQIGRTKLKKMGVFVNSR